jgi:hypothetical protein
MTTSLRCALFAYFLLFAVLFISCSKEPVHQPKTSTIDSVDFAARVIDTGSKTIGATMVASMVTGTIANTSFATSPPVILYSRHDMVINGIATSRISLFNCTNITIKNCKIDPNNHSGINLSNCTNIIIDSCYIYSVSTGVAAVDSKTISITHCQAKNMMGPFPEGQFVQFKNVAGGGNRVSFDISPRAVVRVLSRMVLLLVPL